MRKLCATRLTLALSEFGPISTWGYPTGEFASTPGSTGTIYVNNIRAELVRVGGTGMAGFAVGTIAAHELTHALFGGTVIDTGIGLNHEGGWTAQKMLGEKINWENPGKIHQACLDRHSQGGGGGGIFGGVNWGNPFAWLRPIVSGGGGTATVTTTSTIAVCPPGFHSDGKGNCWAEQK